MNAVIVALVVYAALHTTLAIFFTSAWLAMRFGSEEWGRRDAAAQRPWLIALLAPAALWFFIADDHDRFDRLFTRSPRP